METRIRELRHLRGWTLQQLAERSGTTAQTVQRLETGNMTVSTRWLDRLARAFGVHPADLLAPRRREAAFIGMLGARGMVQEVDEPGHLPLDIPAENAVAVRLSETVGTHARGTILIANRLGPDEITNAHNRDALVALADGPVLLRRVIVAPGGSVILVPCDVPSGDVRYGIAPLWIAPLVMCVEYL